MDLNGSVAIVTGGASGIGKALCHSLLNRGGKVTVADIDEGSGKKTLAEFSEKFKEDNVIFMECDVSDKSSFRHVFSETMTKFGRLDILCNNAGISDEKRGLLMIQINIAGTVIGTELAVEFMGKQNGGHGGVVINTASVGGIYSSCFAPIYCSTKAAVLMYTVCMAATENYKRHGIRMNAFCPSSTQTPLLEFCKTTALHPSLYNSMLEAADIMSPEEVSEPAMELIQCDKNGAVLEFAEKKTKYITLPEFSPVS